MEDLQKEEILDIIEKVEKDFGKVFKKIEKELVKKISESKEKLTQHVHPEIADIIIEEKLRVASVIVISNAIADAYLDMDKDKLMKRSDK